jgi:hypothetical protein
LLLLCDLGQLHRPLPERFQVDRQQRHALGLRERLPQRPHGVDALLRRQLLLEHVGLGGCSRCSHYALHPNKS